MFINDYEYIGKVENGPIKIEMYYTGRRTFTLKKIYAYQVFDDNVKVYENESWIPPRSDLPMVEAAMQEARECLPDPAQLSIEYIECFEVIQ